MSPTELLQSPRMLPTARGSPARLMKCRCGTWRARRRLFRVTCAPNRLCRRPASSAITILTKAMPTFLRPSKHIYMTAAWAAIPQPFMAIRNMCRAWPWMFLFPVRKAALWSCRLVAGNVQGTNIYGSAGVSRELYLYQFNDQYSLNTTVAALTNFSDYPNNPYVVHALGDAVEVPPHAIDTAGRTLARLPVAATIRQLHFLDRRKF